MDVKFNQQIKRGQKTKWRINPREQTDKWGRNKTSLGSDEGNQAGRRWLWQERFLVLKDPGRRLTEWQLQRRCYQEAKGLKKPVFTWLLSWLKSRQYVETLWQAEVYFLLFPFLSLFSAPNTLRSVPSCVKSSALISTLLVAIQETQSFLGCHERANPAVPWSPVLWDRSLLSWVLQTTTPLSPCSTHKSTRHW